MSKIPVKHLQDSIYLVRHPSFKDKVVDLEAQKWACERAPGEARFWRRASNHAGFLGVEEAFLAAQREHAKRTKPAFKKELPVEQSDKNYWRAIARMHRATEALDGRWWPPNAVTDASEPCQDSEVIDTETTWLTEEISSVVWGVERDKVIESAKERIRGRIARTQKWLFCPVCQKNRCSW